MEGRMTVKLANEEGMGVKTTDELLKAIDHRNTAITGVYHVKSGNKIDFFMTASPGHHIGTLVPQEEYETDDMSQRVLEERKKAVISTKKGDLQGDFGNSNYAVYEYEDIDVTLRYVVRKSEGGGLHSEELCEQYLKDQNIPNENIKRIYTERSPCFGTKADCSTRIGNNFPGANVSYTFEYGKTDVNQEFRNFMNSLKTQYQTKL